MERVVFDSTRVFLARIGLVYCDTRNAKGMRIGHR